MAPREKDVDDYCRLCALEVKNGLIIYSSEGITLSLEEKIVQCLRIEVSKDDMLPKKVCEPCHVRLEDCHRFVEQASEVQHTLELLVQMKHLETSISPASSVPKVENDSEIKDEPDDDNVKSELIDLPLDVTLDSDVDSHTDNKGVVDVDEHEDHSAEETRSTTASPSPREEPRAASSPQHDRRRKMLQPQKTRKQCRSSEQSIPYLPSSCEEDTDEEDDDEVEEEQQEPEEMENYEEDAYDNADEDERAHEDPLRELKLNEDELDKLSALKDGEAVRGRHGGRAVDEQSRAPAAGEDAQDWRKTHWGILCNHCKQLFPFKSQFDSHYRSTYDKKPVYTCSYCTKTMEKYSTFRSHCYRHVTEGRYRCEFCKKGFSLRSMLHVHVLAKHTMVKPFICEECGKGFVTRPGLNIHQKKHKFNEKAEYPCKECGKILHTRGGLTAHQNVHRLGRRFMCDVCGKTFTQKVNMQQHVKQHTGERPYSCEKCGKCFAEKSHLNRHYSFHSEKRPYQCKVCMKNYKTERCLKVHSMVHTDARPHVCTYCNKGFLSTTKLKQHYNIHTGERPYVCKFCERTFTNYPNWLKHTRRRHKTEPGALRTGQAMAQAPQQLQQPQEQQPQEQPPLEAAPGTAMMMCELPDDGRLSTQSQQSVMYLGTGGSAGGPPSMPDVLLMYGQSQPLHLQQPQMPLFPEHMMGLHMLPL